MFWNAGGCGYVIVLMKSGRTNLYGWYVTVSSKRVIEVGKTPKTNFFIWSSFCPLFCEKVIFWQNQRGAVIAAVNLIYVLQFVFDDLQHLLISLARGMIFSQYWTTLSIWQDSNILDLQHVHMFMINPMIHMANTKLGIEFEHMNILKIQKVWNLSNAFVVILP